jgi:hypothetical protein
VNQRTKSAVGAAFTGGAAAGILHLVLARPRRGQRLERERLAAAGAGAVAGALLSLLYSPGSMSGLGAARSVHPLHPLHPYRNGPAVWGGRRNGLDDGLGSLQG